MTGSTLAGAASVALLLAGAAPVVGGRLEVVASVRGGGEPSEAVPALVVAEARDGSGRDPRTAEIRAPGAASIELPPGVWEVRLKAAGGWGQPETVAVAAGAPAGAVHLGFWPSGAVTARVRGPHRLTGRLTADFAPERGAAAGGPRGRSDCEVADGRVRCEVPAGAHELRIGLEDHVPHYFFGRRAPAGAELDLGDLTFERGASISGWVDRDDGSAAGERSRVIALPGDGGDFGGMGGIRIRSHAAAVGNNGFFQITGVPPGNVALRAQTDAVGEGHDQPVSVSTPIHAQVVQDRESRLRDPLVLQTPLKLSVVVEPPADPAGEPWEILVAAVSRFGNALAPALQGEVPVFGYWEGEGLAPGDYLVKVSSRSGGQSAFAQLDLGEDPLPVILRLGGVAVEGEVLLGRRPIRATVWFGGRQGAEKVTVRAGSDGRFSTLLPRSGEWLVDVEAEEPPVKTRISAFTVEAPRGGRPAWAEIRLPDTRLRGRVVHEDGRPARATVNVTPAETRGTVQQRTEDDGRFEIRGLPEGIASAGAVARHPRSSRLMLQSDRRILTLTEGSEPAPVELTLQGQRLVQGRVIGPEGPVPAARLGAVSAPGMQFINYMVYEADRDGAFELGVPASARQVALTVGAPGLALASRLVPLADEETTALLHLARAGGTLEIAERPSDAPDDTYEALYLDGAEVHRYFLREWAGIHPGEAVPRDGYLVVPHMAPGFYRLCRTAHPWIGKDASGRRCSEGYLSPGAVLALDLPGAE